MVVVNSLALRYGKREMGENQTSFILFEERMFRDWDLFEVVAAADGTENRRELENIY